MHIDLLRQVWNALRKPVLLATFALSLVFAFHQVRAGGQIIASDSNPIERYAAQELQRYLYQISGELLEIKHEPARINGPAFVIGQLSSSRLVQGWTVNDRVALSDADPGPQGYVLKKLTVNGNPIIVIAASTDVGCLYGVYGLLEDYYGVSFSFSGDILPEKKSALTFPNIDERKKPAVAIRGFLPWTNFPQSATSYSWEDWKFIIDQMAKMRLNFLHIHNYNGECGHNEMFHNVVADDIVPRVWMATARSGHAWGARPGWDPNKYLFGGKDLFDDYDFGADCARHNEFLGNEQVFRKGVTEFQKVIAYAHNRGVKIGLGLDIDILPPEFKERNIKADDARVVRYRIGQVIQDYPSLDYLLCFQSEGIHADPERYRAWRNVFDSFYKSIKERAPKIRMAVAGWGIKAEDVASLPPDVICAPISHYSDECESGAIYGQREYWGCPWMERDFNSSEYYYPYNLHISNTIKAWQTRAPNMKGFYCLTWRLTDAIAPKLAFMAKAPWDAARKLNCSEAVYRDFAERNYGKAVAADITQIINQNEPFASGFGECQATPSFEAKGGEDYLVNIEWFNVHAQGAAPSNVSAAEFARQNSAQTAPCSEGGLCVGFIKDGSWLQFDNVDFGGGADLFEARAASPGLGAEIEARLDSLEGPPLGVCLANSTGDWQNWATFNAAIPRTSGKHTVFLKFREKGAPSDNLGKAEKQLKTIDQCIARAESPAQKARLRLLRCRIAAEKAHIELRCNFKNYTWTNLPGALESWVTNFTYRVVDISSLGNLVSAENRFVQKNYLAKVEELRKALPAQPLVSVIARGTGNGAMISWNCSGNVAGFNVCRDGRKLNPAPLASVITSFSDKADGNFSYTVCSIAPNGQESAPSIPARCAAGSADKTPPHIVVISPPTSARAGQPIWITARILDERAYDLISAQLHYRAPGQLFWHSRVMERRTKAVFCAALPPLSAGTYEYYIEASDGQNNALFPVSAPDAPLSVVVEATGKVKPLATPGRIRVEGHIFSWQPAPGAFWYRIYRSNKPHFNPGPENLLTYVAADTTNFRDNGEDFASEKLAGPWYYRVTAVDPQDFESAPSETAVVNW